MNKEVKHIISQLKKGELGLYDIPEEYRLDSDIIQAERHLGLRAIYRCGYDVINDCFFIEEKVHENIEEDDKKIYWDFEDPQILDNFDDYFKYLNGHIYDNACYYFMAPQKITQSVNQNKLYQRRSFIEDTIDDYNFIVRDSDYFDGERRKKQFIKWLKKFDSCTDADKFKKTVAAYKKSKTYYELDLLSNPWESKYTWDDHRKYRDCFIWHFLKDVSNKPRLDIVMSYLSELPCADSVVRELCTIYNPGEIISAYNCIASFSETENKKQNLRLRNFVKAIEAGLITYDSTRAFYDELTHCYWEEIRYNILPGKYTHSQNMNNYFSTYRIFYNFEDFAASRNGDLSNTNLLKDVDLVFDVSKFTINDSTILPANNEQQLNYILKKYYRNSKFKVLQTWETPNGSIVKKYEHEFDYFCDFVAFLKGDLTNSDLISCDGLEHVIPTNEINLQYALITSNISEKWGISYDKFEITAPAESSFSFPEQNEIETAMVLQSFRDLTANENDDNFPKTFELFNSNSEKIYYISDIHLFHLLRNKKAKSKPDIIKIIRDVVSTIVGENKKGSIILINGDTSLDFSLFQLFVSELGRYNQTVVFTIGNHDIWSCPDDTIDQLTKKYRTLLQENEMFLLQNDILYFNEFGQPPERISEEEINNLTEKELRERTKAARLILFGGVGFSGYNQFFNAETGLYRNNNTIGFNRDIELKETRRFETLYKKVVSVLSGKSAVIMTHMPLPNWYEPAWGHKPGSYVKDSCEEVTYHANRPEDNAGTYSVYQPGFIYVSGHTHKNYYYDDGVIRIYADNQFGYNKSTPNAWPHLKYFEVEKAVDVFVDYSDGIYEITADEYQSFYRGKNICMNFNRETNIIYMLKKNEHYCFIHEAKNKNLSIMNGGMLCRLDSKNINYYYENMDLVISLIKDPLGKYTEYQKRVSEEIKIIGGSGYIHGCIVDIDFFNHVYVNPTDGTITGYWASDIINKLIYPTISALLEEQCPKLFAAYNKILKAEEKENIQTISGQQNSQLALAPVPYLDTDIYRASRQIKKMQKLDANILSTWPNSLPLNNLITE